MFEALTAREQALAGAIVGTNRTFRALASRDEALAETFQIFPTFQHRGPPDPRAAREASLETPARSSATCSPVARDLSPTLRDLRRLSPNARRLFENLDPLIKASATGLPALRSFLDQLRPVMVNLDPFLANFNPIVRYLDYYAPVVTDFLANPAAGTAGALPPIASQTEPRHLSRQLSNLTEPNAESLSVWPSRLRSNRGNGYLMPFAIASPTVGRPGRRLPQLRLREHAGDRRPRLRDGHPDHAARAGRRRRSALESADAGGRLPVLLAGPAQPGPGSSPPFRSSVLCRRPSRRP